MIREAIHDLEIDDSGCSPRFRSLRREALDRAEIVVTLRDKGPLTSREVAICFGGGTGLPRTRERSRAAKLLNDLLADGFVRRSGCGATSDPYVWAATETP